MKKKIIAIVLVICISAVCLVGCDEIFKKNDERDFRQAIATVEYNSTVNGQASYQRSEVMKGEFALSFNSNAESYVQYYGMSYSQAAMYIINSLTQRELMILFAKTYVIENKIDGLDITKLPENCTIPELLTPAEIEKSIKGTNDDLKEAVTSIIADLIEEDEKNKAAVPPTDVVEDSSTDPVTFKVVFDTDGGSQIAALKVGAGKRVVKPADPTKEGYTFGCWKYAGGEKDGQVFNYTTDVINAKTTLKAVWYEFTAPRAVMAEEEDTKEEDFDQNKPVAIQPPYFFSAEYLNKANGYLEFEDETYWDYLDDAVAQLKKNLSTTFRDYDYYLNSEMKTVLLEKFERFVYAQAETETGYEEKVQAEYDRIIAQNRENFAISDKNYETALSSSLASTYYHKYTSPAYGFTKNILLKFDADELDKLTTMVASGIATTEQITAERNRIANDMQIKVSNPDYDSTATCEFHTDEETANCDPMTCPNHECNSKADQNTTADYNQILTFEYSADEGWHIVYNVSECATMAYLQTEWPAFTTGEKIGVVNQIKATLDAVVAARGNAENPLSYTESVYWTRKVSDAWLYLVGDDDGGTNSESNNGGLGYIVSAKGESGYIKEYETQARNLIAIGSGAYSVDNTLAGSYTLGDNFIDEKTVENAYAGVFFIVVTNVPYDENFYTQSGGESVMTGNLLPMDYVMTIAEKEEDNITIYDALYENILSGRKSEIYSILVNKFLNKELEGHRGNITVNEKIYNDFFSKK